MEEDQKRRARRARTDVLDRAMVDLLSFYRDVLVSQMGSDVERVNIDLAEALDRVAASTGPEQSLARIAAIEQCRARLRSNASPVLSLVALPAQCWNVLVFKTFCPSLSVPTMLSTWCTPPLPA